MQVVYDGPLLLYGIVIPDGYTDNKSDGRYGWNDTEDGKGYGYGDGYEREHRSLRCI